MKKKILFITTQFNQGGVEKTFIEAAKVLSPEKYDITLLLRENKTGLVYLLPDYVKVIVNKDGKYQRRPKAMLYLFLKVAFSPFGKKLSKKYDAKLKEYINECKSKNPYKKYFKGQSFDVVISYTVGLCTEMGLEIPAKKRYVFFHSERTDIDRDIMDRCFPRYDRIVACGYGVEKMLRKEFPQYNDKIMTLLNFIDAEKILKMSKEFQPYPAERKDVAICTVGRICRMKGYDMAVKAAAILKSENYSFKWYVVGGGEKEEEIADTIEKRGLQDYFVMVGNKENPFPYIKDCDIYSQTSYNEAQPLAIMEALALGKAIVSTETLGGRAVLEDGEKGLLVPITPEGIAEGIKKFIEDPEYRRSFEKPCDKEYAEKDRLRYKNDWENLLSL